MEDGCANACAFKFGFSGHEGGRWGEGGRKEGRGPGIDGSVYRTLFLLLHSCLHI